MRRCVPREDRLEILRSVTRWSTVDTIATFGPKQKCGLVDSIGRRCMNILKDMLRHALNAKEPGTFLKEIPCP
jgi:hypothetical protein